MAAAHIHNYFRLSPRLASGAAPANDEDFAALAAAGSEGRLVLPKRQHQGITCALALAERAPGAPLNPGQLAPVG